MFHISQNTNRLICSHLTDPRSLIAHNPTQSDSPVPSESRRTQLDRQEQIDGGVIEILSHVINRQGRSSKYRKLALLLSRGYLLCDTCHLTHDNLLRGTQVERDVFGTAGRYIRLYRETILRGRPIPPINRYSSPSNVSEYCRYWVHSAALWDGQVALLPPMCRGGS